MESKQLKSSWEDKTFAYSYCYECGKVLGFVPDSIFGTWEEFIERYERCKKKGHCLTQSEHDNKHNMSNKKLDPVYGIGEYFLLYALREGEESCVLSFTKEKFKELKEKTYFEFRPGDYVKRVYPTIAKLIKVEDAYDFGIDKLNGEYRACGSTIHFKRNI